MKKINRRFIAALIVGVSLISCMKEGACPEKESVYNFQIQMPSLDGSGDYESMDVIRKLDAYIFDHKGANLQCLKDLKSNPEGIIQLNLNPAEINSIYFLANYPDIPANEATTEDDLRNRITPPLTEAPDNFFMTSIYQSSTTRKIQEKLVFTRSASQFDLNTGENPLLEIDSITINNMADRSYLFPHSENSVPENTQFILYKKEFSPSLSGTAQQKQKGIFLAYENGERPVSIAVYGRYDGVNTQVNLTIPSIERNHLYTILLNPIGQTINGTVKVEEWGEGEDINAGYDRSKK